MKKLSAVLISLTLLCSCGEVNTAETETSVSVTETTFTVTETTTTQNQTTETTTKAAEETTAVQTVAEQVDYEYQPPQEVLDAHFYSDDIDRKIEYSIFEGYDPGGQICLEYENPMDYWAYDIVQDEKLTAELHEIIKKKFPEFIAEDMLENSIGSDDEEWSLTVVGLGCMMFDINGDGAEDYLMSALYTHDGAAIGNGHVNKIYLTEGESFRPIVWDDPIYGDEFILKTSTNGLRDIMVLHNSNYPIITYDGGDSYTNYKMLDEKHTFIKFEILPDNILHLNMNISVIDAPLGEYYTAIKFAENPYIKNNLLYTCYTDGKPRTYTEKPFGENTDFSPAIEGYDFYVELTDEGVEAFTEEDIIWHLLDLLEIKYISAE
ncbi:MAG: hypothetical protein HDT25_05565 [Ruminococcus sp.]|nr:hypothetical protein [Ruminococcus sp.]